DLQPNLGHVRRLFDDEDLDFVDNAGRHIHDQSDGDWGERNALDDGQADRPQALAEAQGGGGRALPPPSFHAVAASEKRSTRLQKSSRRRSRMSADAAP